MKLILIPPGQFMMRTPDSEVGLPGSDVTAVTFGRPQHAVEITRPFYLGMFEVTQEEYEKVIGSNPSLFKGDARRPVELVSWSDAVSFCNRLSQRERMQPYYKVDGETVSIAGGAGYRLPTEAEWEHACRAGTTTKRSFGDDASMVGDYAWFVGNAGGGTHKVGEKKPNPWGLYDVHGNVWEWCWDWMYLYEAKPAKDPVSPPYGGGRVLRGGAFTDVAGVLRSAERQANSPGARHLSYGFRTARSCK
jgi:formylglycine-generating enzyme required for sulfatase activity